MYVYMCVCYLDTNQPRESPSTSRGGPSSNPDSLARPELSTADVAAKAGPLGRLEPNHRLREAE